MVGYATLVYATLAAASASVTNAWFFPQPDPSVPVGRRDPHGLDALARRRWRYFGVAWDVYHVENTDYTQLVLAQFGQITPENSLKWETVEPEQGLFNYTNGDLILKTTQRNHMSFRAHTLVWHSQLPAWVAGGNFSKSQLIAVMKNHIVNVAGHFRGNVHTWDVVNEAFNEDGTFRSTVFYDTIGEEYIDIAFRTARIADPFAKLAINDYNIDGAGPKSTGVATLVKRLKRSWVPIDVIGAQAHLIVGSVPTTLQENWQAFADLGVFVQITELDIRMPTPPTPESLAQQAEDYKSVVNACLAVPKCQGITVWGGTDKYSWVPDVFEGEGAPLPWDDDLNPKPAFWAIVRALTSW